MNSLHRLAEPSMKSNQSVPYLNNFGQHNSSVFGVPEGPKPQVPNPFEEHKS